MKYGTLLPVLLPVLASLTHAQAEGPVTVDPVSTFDVGYGSADSLLGYDGIEQNPGEGGGVLVVRAWTVSDAGVFIVDGSSNDLAIFDHRGHFRERRKPRWPEGSSFVTRAIPIDDILVDGDKVYALAGFLGTPTDSALARELTRYQVFVYSLALGDPVARCRFLHEDLVHKYGGYERPYRLCAQGGTVYVFSSMEQQAYPVVRGIEEVPRTEQVHGLPGLPLRDGRVRFNRNTQHVELLDVEGGVRKRLPGGMLTVSGSGGRFAVGGGVITVYDSAGEKLREIDARAIASELLRETPFALDWDRYEFGPDGDLYGYYPGRSSVRVIRWDM